MRPTVATWKGKQYPVALWTRVRSDVPGWLAGAVDPEELGRAGEVFIPVGVEIGTIPLHHGGQHCHVDRMLSPHATLDHVAQEYVRLRREVADSVQQMLCDAADAGGGSVYLGSRGVDCEVVMRLTFEVQAAQAQAGEEGNKGGINV